MLLNSNVKFQTGYRFRRSGISKQSGDNKLYIHEVAWYFKVSLVASQITINKMTNEVTNWKFLAAHPAFIFIDQHGPLNRYLKLRVAHAPGMPGTFSPPLRAGDPAMHHGTCVTHVPRCMAGSLTSGFLSSRWRGKRSRHSRRMRNPQFYVSGTRPMAFTSLCLRTAIEPTEDLE